MFEELREIHGVLGRWRAAMASRPAAGRGKKAAAVGRMMNGELGGGKVGGVDAGCGRSGDGWWGRLPGRGSRGSRGGAREAPGAGLAGLRKGF